MDEGSTGGSRPTHTPSPRAVSWSGGSEYLVLGVLVFVLAAARTLGVGGADRVEAGGHYWFF